MIRGMRKARPDMVPDCSCGECDRRKNIELERKTPDILRKCSFATRGRAAAKVSNGRGGPSIVWGGGLWKDAGSAFIRKLGAAFGGGNED